MAGTLRSTTTNFDLNWDFAEDLSLSTSVNSGTRALAQSFTYGTGAGQVNKIYAARGTVAASSTATINLQSQTDFFGSAYAIDVIRYLYLELTNESLCSSILLGGAGVANPTAAPTLTEITSGSLSAGTYRVAYTWKNATGETMISPVSSITIGASKNIRVTALTLPSGATDVYYYCSFASTGLALGYQGTNGGGSNYDISSLPATNAAAVPQSNTTGTGVTTLFENAFDKIRIRNGGAVFLTGSLDSTGYTVSGTLKDLKITNEDSTYPATYVLIVAGVDN